MAPRKGSKPTTRKTASNKPMARRRSSGRRAAQRPWYDSNWALALAAVAVIGGIGLWRLIGGGKPDEEGLEDVTDEPIAGHIAVDSGEIIAPPTEAPLARVAVRTAPPGDAAVGAIDAGVESATLRQTGDEGDLPEVSLDTNSAAETAAAAAAAIWGTVEYRGMLHDEMVVPGVDRRQCPEHPSGALKLADGHVAEALVWVEGLDAAVSLDRGASFTLDACAITPRAVVVSPGATLTWSSTDDVEHSLVAEDTGGIEAFGVTLDPRAQDVTVSAGAAGLLRVRCERHPWEQALVLVAAHAHASVTDIDGRFDLGRVPVPDGGTATLRLLHPRLGTHEQSLHLEAHQPLKLTIDLTEQVR